MNPVANAGAKTSVPQLIYTQANALVVAAGDKNAYSKQALSRLGYYGQIFWPALFLVFALPAMWASPLFDGIGGVVSAALMLMWWVNTVMTIRGTALLQHNVLLPHFKTSMAWLLLLLFGATVLLATAYVMLVNWAVLALAALYLSLKIRHETTRIIATIVVVVLTECAVVLLHGAGATWWTMLVVAINAQISLATWVAMLFLTIALVVVSPLAGLVSGLIGASLWNSAAYRLRDFALSSKVISEANVVPEFSHMLFVAGLVGVLLAVIFNVEFLRGVRRNRGLMLLLRPAQLTYEALPMSVTAIRRGWAWLPGYVGLLHRAAAAPFSLTRLLPFAFPRDFHWRMVHVVGLAVAACFMLAMWITAADDGYKFANLSSQFTAVFLLYTVIYISRFRLSVHQYHREHKLLSLTPNWPQPHAVNRAVALHILKFFLSILVAAIAVKVGVAYVGGFDASIKPITAVALCVCFLLAFIFALPPPGNRPFSKIRHSIAMWWCFAAYMIFGIICSLGQLVLALCFAMVCVVAAVLQYRRFVRAPGAEPVISRVQAPKS